MTEPMKIQLALQGGGAKIVALMAVMETVQDLEKEGLMKVCRIAGTSAGSLIGCLFAAGISMSELRAELIAGKGKALVGLFPSPKWHHLARLPLSGRPFWNSGRLASALREKFGKRNMRKLEDLTIEVLVVSANLSTTTKNVHKPTDDIVSSIMDSCGIPYFFRTWDKQGA